MPNDMKGALPKLVFKQLILENCSQLLFPLLREHLASHVQYPRVLYVFGYLFADARLIHPEPVNGLPAIRKRLQQIILSTDVGEEANSFLGLQCPLDLALHRDKRPEIKTQLARLHP